MNNIQGNEKIVIVTVGLPASGKTHLCSKVLRYINWIGYEAEIFSIAAYRRKLYGVEVTPDFFDPYNKEAFEIRQKCAEQALEDLIKFMND